MSRAIPESRIIRQEDVSGGSPLPPQMTRLIYMINRQTEYLRNLISGKLEIGNHVIGQVQKLTAYDPAPLSATPAIFYRFKRTLPSAARAVMIGSVNVSGSPTSQTPISSAYAISWTEANGEILITKLPGFSDGTLYDITLVVI